MNRLALLHSVSGGRWSEKKRLTKLVGALDGILLDGEFDSPPSPPMKNQGLSVLEGRPFIIRGTGHLGSSYQKSQQVCGSVIFRTAQKAGNLLIVTHV